MSKSAHERLDELNKMVERERRIVEMRREGKLLREIAEEYGLSLARVSRIWRVATERGE